MAADLSSYTDGPFEYTLPPNPQFQFGQAVDSTPQGKKWVEGEKEGWKVIDTATEDPLKLYPLMISAIVPRPVAFVSSIAEDGTENLALFSWFNMVTAYPPVISVSISNLPATGFGSKDSSRNIRATKQFTVNIISEAWVGNANACSLDAPPDVSEWPISGLTKAPSLHVKPARVKESAFSMECELFQAHDIIHPSNGLATTVLILGLVKHVHVRKDMLNERGNVDPAKLQPVGRLGDILYGSLGGGYRIPRPAWKDVSEGVQALNKEKEDSSAQGSSL